VGLILINKIENMKKINFAPEAGLIVVSPIVVEPKKTAIITPQSIGKAPDMDEFDKHPYQATIIAVGPKFKDDPIANVVPGDIVYLTRPLGQREAVLVEGTVYGYIRRSEIIGRLIK
jgi:co-chaperonin GroES (HSP10)